MDEKAKRRVDWGRDAKVCNQNYPQTERNFEYGIFLSIRKLEID